MYLRRSVGWKENSTLCDERHNESSQDFTFGTTWEVRRRGLAKSSLNP